MKTVNVSGLKNNPSEALRNAKKEIVLVMNRDQPDSVLIGLEQTKMLDMEGVRAAMATNLFRDGDLSLARSAKLANMPLADFIAHISRLGIPVISLSAEEAEKDMDTLDQVRLSSDEESLLEKTALRLGRSKGDLARQAVQELCQKLVREERSAYALGKDLFDSGELAEPPADPLKHKIWDKLRDKHSHVG